MEFESLAQKNEWKGLWDQWAGWMSAYSTGFVGWKVVMMVNFPIVSSIHPVDEFRIPRRGWTCRTGVVSLHEWILDQLSTTNHAAQTHQSRAAAVEG